MLLADVPLKADSAAPPKGDKSRMLSSSDQGSCLGETDSITSQFPPPPLPPRLYGQSSAQAHLIDGGRRDLVSPTRDTQSQRSAGFDKIREERPYSSHQDQRVTRDQSKSKKSAAQTKDKSVVLSQDNIALSTVGTKEKGGLRAYPSAPPQSITRSVTALKSHKPSHKSDPGKTYDATEAQKADQGGETSSRMSMAKPSMKSKPEIRSVSSRPSQLSESLPSRPDYVSSPHVAADEVNVETGAEITESLEPYVVSSEAGQLLAEGAPLAISVHPPSSGQGAAWRETAGSLSDSSQREEGAGAATHSVTSQELGDEKQRMVSGKLSDPIKGRVKQANSELQGPSSSPVISAKDRHKIKVEKLVPTDTSKPRRKGVVAVSEYSPGGEDDSDHGSIKGQKKTLSEILYAVFFIHVSTNSLIFCCFPLIMHHPVHSSSIIPSMPTPLQGLIALSQ